MSRTVAMGRLPDARYFQAILALARTTWLEALRSRWTASLVICIVLILATATFIGAWALVEREQVTLAIIAPLTRLLAFLITSLVTVSIVVREFSDRSIMLTLSAPLSRAAWVFGKGLGCALIALATASALSLPIILLAPASAALLWTVSLGLELVVLACAAVLIACVLRQIPAAVLALTVFYILSRLIGVLMLIAERAPYESSAQASQLSFFFLKTLGALLPRLDLYTQSAWLFEAAPASVLWPLLTQSLLYCIVLWLVACLDFSSAEL